MAEKLTFWQSKKRTNKIVGWVLYVVAWSGAIIFVIPLIWMISTSFKAPDQIFTIPPKWIPISSVSLEYDTQIKAKKTGTVNITKGEGGIKVVRIKGAVHVVPEVGKVKVYKGEKVSRGTVVGTMPSQGKVRIYENDDIDSNTLIKVLDKKKRVIKEYRVPSGSSIKVKDGDTVKVGQKLATVLPQWKNYVKAWAPEALDETFNRYLFNTIFVTVMGILGVILSSTFVAYGFARFRFPFRDPLFLIMISTMMIPVQVTMIPTFILFKYLGWIDTFAPLIIPTFFGGGAFNIFLMRQFFMTIPYELDDAAKIDGCNYFQIFYIILLPLVKPAIATVAIFGFVYNWNDFLNPLIYLNSSSNYTLALGLQTFTTMYGTDYNLMMAASTIVLLPILIVFFFGQRYFIEGVATSGLKG